MGAHALDIGCDLCAVCVCVGSPLLYSIVSMLQQGRAGDSAPSGVSLDDPTSSHPTHAAPGAATAAAAPQFQPQSSVGSSTASYQPGQPRPHAQSRQPNFGQDDAPKPLQFTNRF